MVLKRNLEQTRGGGYDIVGIDWLAVEVKHQTMDRRDAWWEQTKKQAELSQEPILVYKLTGAKWWVRMYGRLQYGSDFVRCPVDITVAAFLVYFRQRLKKELIKSD